MIYAANGVEHSVIREFNVCVSNNTAGRLDTRIKSTSVRHGLRLKKDTVLILLGFNWLRII